jgi:hypothetical protein
MQIAEALTSLGACPEKLTAAEIQSLDQDGFLVLPNILAAEQVSIFRLRLDLLGELEGADAGKEVHQEAGTARLSNLVDKGESFRICFTHPKVLSAIAHVLGGDMKLSSLNSRAALPGQGLQHLHADWAKAVEPGEYQVCNSIWLIDDFTAENGATRAVAGTHRSGKMPGDVMKDTMAEHPEQRVFIAPAGTVVVFNSHTWHGGTVNRTKSPRRAIHSYFCRRQHAQQLAQRRYLSPATVESLPPAVRCILDVE